MFKKVLVAEDHESANISIRKTLVELGVHQTDYVFYCDDALARIKKALNENEPYDLLVTDLSFEEDHIPQNIIGGAALVNAAKELQQNLKTLVFSAENKPTFINILFKESGINGYVRKARNDAQELKEAISEIYRNKKYLSVSLRQVVKEKNSHEFTTFDVTVISLLAQGKQQKNIPAYLEQKNIKPSGLSSIEKRLNTIKEVLSLASNEQLIAFCKDMGVI